MQHYIPVSISDRWYVKDVRTGRLIPCEGRTVAIDHAARLNLIARLRAKP